MICRIFLMTLAISSFFVSQGWSGDCAQFISDFKEGKIVSSKAYQFESEELYFPDVYCPFSPLSYVTSQDSRAEFYIVEQCRETGYKVLKTTLMCAQDAVASKVRSSCDVNEKILSPCLKSELAEALMQTEPA